MIVNLTKENFEQEVLKNEKLVLVDFWADWCGPCKRFGEVLHNLNEEINDNVIIAKVNVDEEEELAKQFNIYSIPSIFIFKNGEIVEKFLGGKSKEDVKKILEKHI